MIENQITILKEINFSGIGLHTGKKTNMKFKPALENTGLIFLRIDHSEPIEIKASLENVIDTNRGTTLGVGRVHVHTVEHVLSSLYALGIDNLIIELDNIEPPILDGSSKIFVDAIVKIGIKELNEKKKYLKITQPINFYDERSDITLSVTPSRTFKISFECDFSFGNIGNQKYNLNSLDKYIDEIASARTFCSLDELLTLKKNNLINGATINSGIVFLSEHNSSSDIKNIQKALDLDIENFDNRRTVLNNVKLRYEDEPVRHKILDLIGDLALIGKPIIGHIHSYKSGHRTNVEFGKKIIALNNSFKFTKNQIKEIIPHRDPFLLIDEIIGGIPGKKVIAIKNVTTEDYFFKGHFPDKPIMPGVLILECMAQASCFLSINTVNNKEKKMMLLSVINSSKFTKKVLPGDQLFIEVELLKYKLKTASIKGTVKVNEKIVAKAEFMATVVNKNE